MPLEGKEMMFGVGQTANIDPKTKQPIPIVVFGLTKKACKWILTGDNFHQFDLTRQGIAAYVMFIGAETRAHLIDRMSVMMPGPKVADMHSDNKIPLDEQAIPKMVARVRKHFGDRVVDLDNEQIRERMQLILTGDDDGP